MPRELPGWVIDDDASIRREVEPYRALTPTERWRATQLCARDAIWAARVSGRRERALAHVDPLPPSTVALLERLREGRRA